MSLSSHLQCSHTDTIEDQENGQVICNDCYIVLDKHCQTGTVSSVQGLYPLNSFKMGLSSTITPKAVDYAGRKIKSKHLTDLLDSSHKAKASTAVEKNKFKGILELQRICGLLDLPAIIQERTKETFLDFTQRGLLKGKHLYSCMYAILMITACEQEYPLSLKQILKYTAVSRKRINSDFYTVFQLYKSAPRIGLDARTHLQELYRMVDYHWEGYDRFRKDVQSTLKTINHDSYHGRSALVVGVLVCYLVLKYHGYSENDKFLKQTSLGRSTLVQKLSELKYKYPDVVFFQ